MEQQLTSSEPLICSPMSTRYSDSQWWSPGKEIMVIGLGNIGSWLTLLLSKLEPSMAIYDMDSVEVHNVGVSSYPLNSVGMLKTQIANRMMNEHSGISASAINGRYDDDSMTCAITFIGADNMTVRNQAFEMWVKNHGDDEGAMFIDGRSTMEYIETYYVMGGNEESISKYRATLFSDNEDIGELPCGAKSSGHFGAIIAGYMVTGYTNHIANIALGDNLKMIPYSTKFNGLMFELDAEDFH